MQNNRNPRFTIFIHHFHLNHARWMYVKDTGSVVFRLKVEEMRPMDVMLMEYLTNVDMDILEQDKGFMQIFNIRYLALGL